MPLPRIKTGSFALLTELIKGLRSKSLLVLDRYKFFLLIVKSNGFIFLYDISTGSSRTTGPNLLVDASSQSLSRIKGNSAGSFTDEYDLTIDFTRPSVSDSCTPRCLGHFSR